LITVYAAMHVILGFLLAAFLLLLVQPAYRRRIERFATERIKRSLPLTESEIIADKDRIRAGFAIDVHKLEMKLEDSAIAAARQSVEINRRDAKVHDLEQAIETHKLSVEEHENARRVLEQAILDRLPKVEQRLSEARKLLVQRDREIMLLTDTGAKQSEALEEATQINTQQRGELERTKVALETRAARNRETLGDPRFDGEVALRSEIEELRAKSRDQANLIDKLQKAAAKADASEIQSAQSKNEIDRLKSELAKAEAKLLSFEGSTDDARTALETQVRELEAAASASAAEMAKMMAALKAFADNANDPVTGRTPATLSAKVEISQLQTEVDEQRHTIESLRAEISGSNERLVRQSQYFRDELRRLGAAPAHATDAAARTEAETPRRSLAERIAAPRIPASHSGADMTARTPTGTVLTALNGGAGDASAPVETETSGDTENDSAAPRRPRLLDRISGLDK
jgi:DNA repair exonuclease SbcCD ATPase subunit